MGDAAELDAIAGTNRVFGAETSVYLEHVARGLADAAGFRGEGLCLGDDPDDLLVCPNEDHVERQRRILHPKALLLLRGEYEEHPRIWRQIFSIHQPVAARLRCVGNLDVDGDVALLTVDQHLLSLAAGGAGHQ